MGSCPSQLAAQRRGSAACQQSLTHPRRTLTNAPYIQSCCRPARAGLRRGAGAVLVFSHRPAPIGAAAGPLSWLGVSDRAAAVAATGPLRELPTAGPPAVSAGCVPAASCHCGPSTLTWCQPSSLINGRVNSAPHRDFITCSPETPHVAAGSAARGVRRRSAGFCLDSCPSAGLRLHS